MNQRLLHIFIYTLVSLAASAQDPHFTQSGALGQWYNPAALAPTDDPYRVQVLYRNQWASAGSPFVTQGIVGERRFGEHALGFMVVNNGAGAGSIRQLLAAAQWSVTRQWGIHRISGGVHAGFIQRSLQTKGMTFDEQYDPDQGFNASLNSGEQFADARSLSPDFGCGIRWSVPAEKGKILSPFAGIGVQHLTRGTERFVLNTYNLDQRVTLEAGTGIVINEGFLVKTAVQYVKQGVANELQLTMNPEFSLPNGYGLGGMLVYRAKDALALGAQLRWSRYGLGMSYDINTSGIQGAPGSFELILSYRPAVKPRAIKPVVSKHTDEKTKPEEVQRPVAETIQALTPLTVHAPESRITLEPIAVTYERTEQELVPLIMDEELALLPTLSNPSLHISDQAEAKPVRIQAESTSLWTVYSDNDEHEATTSNSEPTHTEKTESRSSEVVLAAEKRSVIGVAETLVPVLQPNEPIAVFIAERVSQLPINTDTDEIGLMDIRPLEYTLSEISIPDPIRTIQESTSGLIIVSTEEVESMQPMAFRSENPPVNPVQPNLNPVSVIPVSTATVADESQETIATAVTDSLFVPFTSGSLRVHGLSKLDIIEPALDRVLNNPELNIELAGVSSNHTLDGKRVDIVREILVTKGLDPGRIRIVDADSDIKGTREAVRIRIMVNR